MKNQPLRKHMLKIAGGPSMGISCARNARAPADAFSLRAQVAFLLATYSSVSSLPALKPVRAVQDVSPEFQDAAFHCGEFDTVHHRGKALAARRRALGQELD